MKKADTKLTVKKTAPKGKAAKDPNKPKRPANAFFVFMEAFRKQFKEENPTINYVVAVGKAGGAKWNLMSESEKAPFVAESEQRKVARFSSVQSVISNNDLLTEILIKLPLLSLVLFKSVSKQWFSLIKDVNVTFRQNLDPHAGLFLDKFSYTKDGCAGSRIYDFVPLDIRIPICRSSLLATNFTFGPDVHSGFEILDSCNGLFLCHTLSSKKVFVYNPSITDMFKVIPEPHNVKFELHCITGGLKMAFDPTKSPHYKLIYGSLSSYGQIYTYSSETVNWSPSGYRFPDGFLFWFRLGVYWNGAIYWINYISKGKIFKLDIMNEHPVLTDLRTPLILDVKDYGECRLFGSRGCLLLVGKDNGFSGHFTIYEKGNVDSEWSVKYIINLDDIIKPFPKSGRICRILYCIVLEEREEDSFFVLQLGRKVVQQKIVAKTRKTIFHLEPNDNLSTCFQFIPSFANV